MIFVLGACPVEIIGDRFETTVTRFRSERNTDGFTAHQWAESGFPGGVLDWMFETLAALPQVERANLSWVASEEHFFNKRQAGTGRIPPKERMLNLRGCRTGAEEPFQNGIPCFRLPGWG